MFGIGPAEILIVLAAGLFCVGVPIAIVVLLVVLPRGRDSDKE